MQWIPLIVFITTLVLIIKKPFNLGIGYSAMGAAIILFLLGFVKSQALIEVISITWNATIAFVALIVICFILNIIGFFEWSALHMIKLSNRSCKRLFINLIILGAIVSALFANDGAALILTPLIIAKMRLLNIKDENIIPFVMAGGFIADSASLLLVTSNLVNIIAANYFDISYLEYAKFMCLPYLISSLASLLILYLFYRKRFSFTCNMKNLPSPATAIKDSVLFKISWLILLIMFVFCFISGYFDIPVSLILLPTAILFSLLAFQKKLTTPRKLFHETPFSIIFFAIGMYIIIFSLRSIGLIEGIQNLLIHFSNMGSFAATLLVGYFSAILSCIVNNLPSVMVVSVATKEIALSPGLEKLLTFANIIGADIGPKMIPIGSLATLLWLYLLEKERMVITWSRYIKTGIILTLPTLFISLATLYIWTLIIS